VAERKDRLLGAGLSLFFTDSPKERITETPVRSATAAEEHEETKSTELSARKKERSVDLGFMVPGFRENVKSGFSRFHRHAKDFLHVQLEHIWPGF
jgi:hypothetical protein